MTAIPSLQAVKKSGKLLALAFVCLAICGCPGVTKQMKDARATLEKWKLDAVATAQTFKASQPTPADVAAVKAAYTTAASKNTNYRKMLQSACTAAGGTLDSPAITQAATEAADSYNAFIKLAQEKTNAAARPMGIAVTTAAVTAVAADIILKVATGAWDKYKQDQQAEVAKFASGLDETAWPAWDAIP